MMGFIKRNLLSIVVLAILSVFSVQTYVGEHGLQARSSLKARIAGLNKKHQLLVEKRRELQRKTKLLSVGAVDRDMLEFKARELLNFVYKKERVYVRDGSEFPSSGRTSP